MLVMAGLVSGHPRLSMLIWKTSCARQAWHDGAPTKISDHEVPCELPHTRARFGVLLWFMNSYRGEQAMTQTTAATFKTLAGITACGAFAAFMAFSGAGPMEATSRMERLAGQIERAQTIQPEAAAEIARLTSNGSYDCMQVSCSKAHCCPQSRGSRAARVLGDSKNDRGDGRICEERAINSPLASQYRAAIGSSSAGNSVITRQPLSVTTTSSSMRAAEKPSFAGQ